MKFDYLPRRGPWKFNRLYEHQNKNLCRREGNSETASFKVSVFIYDHVALALRDEVGEDPNVMIKTVEAFTKAKILYNVQLSCSCYLLFCLKLI